MSFRQPIPPGQPRTLRSIAQSQAAPANLEADTGFDLTNGGLPATERQAFQQYQGQAEGQFPTGPQQTNGAFKNLRRGG